MECTITCPKCGYQAIEQMPIDACQLFYECKRCGERLKPLPGDCCVFCSFGSIPCPPIQAERARQRWSAPQKRPARGPRARGTGRRRPVR
jgi:hypothetical protein